MKTLKLLALAAFALLFSQCKSTAPTGPGSSDRKLTDVTKILDRAGKQFIYFDSITPGNPKQAIMNTRDWLATQPTVASAETVDSIYINIVLSNGLQTTFSYEEIASDGHPVFRGGGTPVNGVRLDRTSQYAKNKIENRNVLIYAPGFTEFYKAGEMEKITALLAKSGLVSTTLITDKNCTFEMIKTFKDYGLVIIDTHGEEDAFWVGATVDTAADNDEELLKANVLASAGPNAYALIQSNDLRLVKATKWKVVVTNGQKHAVKTPYYRLFATSKYIQSMPDLTGTVVFGNFCYSGYTGAIPEREDNFGNVPIGAAIVGKQPISYYGYAFDSKRSSGVDDGFAKAMEDSLVRALLIRGDSTGIAHLDATSTPFFDEDKAHNSNSYPHLNFVHFGADNYDYQLCTNVFTDPRDGIIYKTVCIGKQTWMAENLRYNAPGSKCYDDETSNCDLYGRLYDWNTVMNGSVSSDKVPSGVQGVCPKGWHIPSQAEWQTLIDFCGGQATGGAALKSTSSWDGTVNVTNSSGFTGLAAGVWDYGLNKFASKGTGTALWSSTEFDPVARAYYVFLSYFDNRALMNYSYKQTGGSCRCLKDN